MASAGKKCSRPSLGNFKPFASIDLTPKDPNYSTMNKYTVLEQAVRRAKCEDAIITAKARAETEFDEAREAAYKVMYPDYFEEEKKKLEEETANKEKRDAEEFAKDPKSVLSTETETPLFVGIGRKTRFRDVVPELCGRFAMWKQHHPELFPGLDLEQYKTVKLHIVPCFSYPFQVAEKLDFVLETDKGLYDVNGTKSLHCLGLASYGPIPLK